MTAEMIPAPHAHIRELATTGAAFVVWVAPADERAVWGRLGYLERRHVTAFQPDPTVPRGCWRIVPAPPTQE